MKNFITVIVMLLLVGSAGLAQILNPGFESWTDGNPDSWTTNNFKGVYSPVTSSTTSHSGTLALRGEVITFSSIIIWPLLQSGVQGRGFAYTQRPASMTAYYQFFPADSSGDRFSLGVVLYKGGRGGTVVAAAEIALNTSVSAYTQISALFHYSTSDIPDTCVISVNILGPGTGTQANSHVGSSYLVDDLAFSGTTDVNSLVVQPNAFRLDQNFPNPFNPSTEIQFQLPGKAQVRLVVYNILGQQVKELVNSEMNAGSFTATWDGKNDRGEYVGSGVYLYKIIAGNYLVTKKMLLMK
jgi:hypothetical protein